tara:strand:- start:1653 stop:2069 length:417 start_codon:yes stop_codon:yes gene_type:complete
MSELTLWGEEIKSNPLHHWKGFEHHVCDVLKPKYPNAQEQKSIGPKVNGRKHVVDVYIPETRTLVSVKLQNVGGTAEEKCPYEMFTLQRACKKYGYSHAYIVLGGNGWTIKKDLYKINKLYSHVTLVEYEDDKNLSLI